MNVTNLSIQLSSDNPDRLYAFYKDVVGLPVVEGMGDRMLHAGPAMLSITTHSETHGKTAEPSRQFIDFWVQDAEAERQRMEAAGAPFIRKEGVEYWGGKYSTFVDPDGNYGQLMSLHPELATAPGA